MPISIELAQVVERFFLDLDFIVMFSIVAIISFLLTKVGWLFFPELFDTNFTYYMIILYFFLLIWHLIKESIIPFDFRDE